MHYACVVLAPCRRGRKPNPISKRKPYLLSPEELESLFKTRYYSRTLVSSLVGSMKILLNNHHFELLCNKMGNHYYRCVSFVATQCSARVLDRGGRIYVIDGTHNHAQPDPPKLSSVQCRRDTDEETTAKKCEKPQIDTDNTARSQLPHKMPSTGKPMGKLTPGPAKIDLKAQIAKRLKQLHGFGDMAN